MNRVSRVIAAVLVAMPLLAGSAFAASSTKTKGQSLVGTLQKVDGQTLTVQTSKGIETVMLASNAKVQHGSKTIAASDLAAQTGARVKVHYSEANGQKEARSVTVSSEKTAHAATAAKPSSQASKK